MFCDVETKRVFNHKKYGGLYPWKGDKICGVSITVDDLKDVYYVPVRHTSSGGRGNLPIAPVMRYFRDIFAATNSSGDERRWINHNVNFDAMMFDVGDDVEFNCKIVDTVTLSKIHYSDMMQYGLKSLCRDWLDYDTGSTDRVKSYLDSIKSKSYADVPIDIMGEYACDDVRMNRKLYRMLVKERPVEQKQLWETEILLTPVLFDMEKRGMCIDETECKKRLIRCLNELIIAGEELEGIIGREFVNSNQCFYEVLVQRYGLPILKTIWEKDEELGKKVDTGRATFDKDALVLYQNHPTVLYNEEIKHVIDLMMTYRSASQFKSLYLDTFLELNVDGVIHPSYNQTVRTGRMSCSRPNGQQQNYWSKQLLHPHKGYGYISKDYSQIEYRFIAHYIKDQRLIDAYTNDPTTDFHSWVASMAHIERSPAKTLNFGMAFGSGKKLVTSNLTVDESIVKEMGLIVDKMIGDDSLSRELREVVFIDLCSKHALKVFDTYHEQIPGIRATSKAARINCSIRGYVFNLYGRRRHLPSKLTYRAFNSIVQGSAADFMKERMVAISPRYNSESRRWGIEFAANVHDELLVGAPVDVLNNPELHKFMDDTMNTPSVKLRVPVMSGLGISYKNWSESAGSMTTVETSDGELITMKHKEYLEHLKIYASGGTELANQYKFVSGKLR